MTDFNWHPVHAVDYTRLSAARAQAHVAAQWLARAAFAYIPPQPDDRHSNLGWDDGFGGLVTHALPDCGRLGLKVADLTLAVLDGAGADPVLALDGCRDAQVRAWLGRQMAARGFDPNALDAPPRYEMPMLASGATYAVADLLESLRMLAAWESNAAAALGAQRADVVARKLDAPPVRCWPHHFDFDTLVTLAPGRTTGVGFSPGDHFYEEPYFSVSLYPGPDAATLPPLPPIGHWHTNQFTAAVATAGRIVEAKDQKREVEAFLHEAVNIAVKALS
jgi:hypothetical protein